MGAVCEGENMSIIVRQARSDDLKNICTLVHRSLPPTAALWKVIRLKSFYDPSAYNSSAGVGFVAEENGQLLGHAASIKTNLYSIELRDLFVAQTARGKGIANSLADARMDYLADFQGIIMTHAITSVPQSQRINYSRGLVPVGLHIRVTSNYNEEHGQDDSAITMIQYRIPQLHPPHKLYVPPSFRDFTKATFHRVFEGYDPLVILDAEETIPSQKFLEGYAEYPRRNGMTLSFHDPNAGAHIAYLQDAGFYFSEFVFPIKDDRIYIAAHFRKKPEATILREHLHIIPEAREITDFVWEQYHK